jgi:hypothetical protein
MKLIIGFVIIIFVSSCGIPPHGVPAFYINADKTIRDVSEVKKGRNIGPWAYTKNQRDKINK